MRYLPVIAFALLFAAPAKADKFWLSDPKVDAAAPAGSSPNLIEGVLLAENDEGYHIRVVGGELVLPKQRVFQVEKDGLTLDAIVQAERDALAAGERANEERRLVQRAQFEERRVRIAEATARRRARAVEASTGRGDVVVAPATFDPVLSVATGSDHYAQMRDARLMWEHTRDRSYLKLLRRLRRWR